MDDEATIAAPRYPKVKNALSRRWPVSAVSAVLCLLVACAAGQWLKKVPGVPHFEALLLAGLLAFVVLFALAGAIVASIASLYLRERPAGVGALLLLAVTGVGWWMWQSSFG